MDVGKAVVTMICAVLLVGCDVAFFNKDQGRALGPLDQSWSIRLKSGETLRYTPELAEKIKSKGWVDGKWPCNIAYKLMNRSEYLECILVEAALLPDISSAPRDHFGERYDPRDYLECRAPRKRNDMSCLSLRVRRNENPEYWPYPEVPKPKWPEPPQRAKYREGMSSEEYFRELCGKEAGEFIYRTVEGVEGIYQIRPRVEEDDWHLADRYVMEDPFGYFIPYPKGTSYLFVSPPHSDFRFFESPVDDAHRKHSGSLRYIKYEGHEDVRDIVKAPGKSWYVNKKYSPMKGAEEDGVSSRFGYVWRGIERLHDRELGIAGGEVMVVDLKSNQVLGIRRGFMYGVKTHAKNGINWLVGPTCPVLRGETKFRDTYRFVRSVLKP
ncbi:hypothetical protein [Endothiovibrio diazotrophicus]